MAKITIDLLDRYQNAFSFIPRNVIPRVLPIGLSSVSPFGNLDMITVGDVSFDNFILKGAGYELKFGSFPFSGGNHGLLEYLTPIIDKVGKKRKVSPESDVFAPPPMLSFSRDKNMTVTQIDGSDNEVIELFGLKAWDIKMQGLLIDMEKHQYPEWQENTLHEIFKAGEIFEVSGKLFENKEIRSIYFRKIDISGVAGYPDTIKYTLSARSIKPAEFQLLNQIN